MIFSLTVLSYTLTEDDGPSSPIGLLGQIEVEWGPMVTAASSLERHAVRIYGDNAVIVSEDVYAL